MKTCLIVDDSEVVRKTMRRIVEDLRFICIEAEHGEAAYDICRSQMPDVITLDWNMPVMDGYEFLKKLRKTAGGDKPKVIFCSTQGDAKKIRTVIEAGADEYVIKPFDTAIIHSKFKLLNLLDAA